MDRRYWKALFPIYLFYVLALPAGMLALELVRLPDTTICGLRVLTGLDCPSCGLTRAFQAMGRLDVAGAFRYNPLGPALFLGTLAFWGYATGMVCTGGRLRLPAWWRRHRIHFAWVALAIFLLVGLGRMGYELRHPSPPTRASQYAPYRWLLPTDSGAGR